MWIELPKHVLKPAEWNYKTTDAKKMKKLERNMIRNGLIQNLIVRPVSGGFYEVVNGNHRLEIMQYMKIDKVMCFNLGNITETQAKRIAIETNETSFGRDDGKLAGLLKELHVEFDTKELYSTLAKDLIDLDKIINKTVTQIEEIDLEIDQPVYSTGGNSVEKSKPIDYQATRIDKTGNERVRRVVDTAKQALEKGGSNEVSEGHAAMKFSSQAPGVKQLEDDTSHADGGIEWYDPKNRPKEEMRTIKHVVPKSVKELYDMQLERIQFEASEKKINLTPTQCVEVVASILNHLTDEQISQSIS